MKTLREKYGKWIFLSKSHIGRDGCQYINCCCADCGDIKCIARAQLLNGNFTCNCQNGNKINRNK